MGTSAGIQVEGIEFAQVYMHWDGYPEHILPFLEDFNKDFAKNRGNDPEYKFAQLLRDTVRKQEKYNLDGSLHTGWGVVSGNDNNFDFVYVLRNDGSVSIKYYTLY